MGLRGDQGLREWFIGLSTAKQVAVSAALAPFVLILVLLAGGCGLVVFQLARALAVAVLLLRP